MAIFQENGTKSLWIRGTLTNILSQLDDSDRAGYVFQAIGKGLGRPHYARPDQASLDRVKQD